MSKMTLIILSAGLKSIMRVLAYVHVCERQSTQEGQGSKPVDMAKFQTLWHPASTQSVEKVCVCVRAHVRACVCAN